MSYCRWSTDDFNCDVYAYESTCGGIEVNIASCKIVGDVPKIDYKNLEKGGSIDEFIKQYKKQMDFLATAKHESIGLPLDGESFVCDDLFDFKIRMGELRSMGYDFPDYVLKMIEEEINELNPNQ